MKTQLCLVSLLQLFISASPLLGQENLIVGENKKEGSTDVGGTWFCPLLLAP
jgi:hypothetical protein